MLDLPDDITAFTASLSDADAVRMAEAIKAQAEAEKFGKFGALFPGDGELRRDLYPRHLEFFSAGATYRERCFMAGNRVGKTVAGGYEFTCHVTGQYPDWWEGRRFHRPIRAWAAGDTNETTRDVIQRNLFGEIGYRGQSKIVDGSGLIPRDTLVVDEIDWKQGVANLIDTIKVKHVTGGLSTVGLKSYNQGRKSFQGTEQDLIWADEECELGIYTEMLMRTMTTNGLTMLTYTPLEGLTDTVLAFLPSELRPSDA